MAVVLNVRVKAIMKSGTALSRNSGFPWMEKYGLAIPQTACSNKLVCLNSFKCSVTLQNAKYKDAHHPK